MPTITEQTITFEQLIKNNSQLCNDIYQIANYVLTPNRIDVGINCPFNSSKDNCAFYFVNVDGVIGARVQMFGTQINANGEVIPAGSGSSFETAEEFRHLGIGADVMMHFTMNDEYTTAIVSGISEMALPLYKKLKYHILEFPRIMQLRRSRCILESKGLKGGLLKITSTLMDLPIKIIIRFSTRKGHKLKKQFSVEKVTTVPTWVDNIVLNDGHKYMEAHDHKWLQWNLDYNFSGLERDIQSFYIIKKDGKPIGFFMTKERFRKLAGGTLKNIILAAIMEWGSVDEKILSETDIYDIAMTTFSEDVDILETATVNIDVVKKMKKRFFIPHGFAHIAIKDKKKQYKDAKDINLWRVRYGYGDVIFT